MNASQIFHVFNMPHQTHLPLFDHINNIPYTLWNST